MKDSNKKSKPYKRFLSSIWKCKNCGKEVSVVYYDFENRKWLCVDCKFRKIPVKTDKYIPKGKLTCLRGKRIAK